MKNYMFLILYCYVSCANVCVLHDSFMDFGNDIVVGNWPKSGKSLEKDEELIQQLVAKYKIAPNSLDRTVTVVRRAIIKDIKNAMPKEKNMSKIKSIAEQCMEIILKKSGRKDVK